MGMILVDIGPHPSMEGRGQMVVVATTKVVAATKVVATKVVVATKLVVVGNEVVAATRPRGWWQRQ
jgi:hypothetical protein